MNEAVSSPTHPRKERIKDSKVWFRDVEIEQDKRKDLMFKRLRGVS